MLSVILAVGSEWLVGSNSPGVVNARGIYECAHYAVCVYSWSLLLRMISTVCCIVVVGQLKDHGAPKIKTKGRFLSQ